MEEKTITGILGNRWEDAAERGQCSAAELRQRHGKTGVSDYWVLALEGGVSPKVPDSLAEKAQTLVGQEVSCRVRGEGSSLVVLDVSPVAES